MSEANEFSEEYLKRIAAQKIKFRFFIRIHLVVYILVNILLFFINFVIAQPIITFQTSWFLYPLLGWFVGLTMHTLSYILFARGVYPIAKRGVFYHLAAYLTTIILLIVNNLQIIPGYLWVLWPGIFWGIALVGHIVIYFLYFNAKIIKTGELKSRKEQAIQREITKMRKRMEKKRIKN